MYTKRLILAALLFAVPLHAESPAVADAIVDPAALAACLAKAKTDNTPPAQCLAAANAPCAALNPTETPALATLCLSGAKDDWTRATATRLDEIAADAPEAIITRARIDAKYDLLSGLLQCDRLEEIGRAANVEAEPLLYEKTRCQASAAAATYARLLMSVTKD